MRVEIVQHCHTDGPTDRWSYHPEEVLRFLTCLVGDLAMQSDGPKMKMKRDTRVVTTVKDKQYFRKQL